MAGEDFVEAGLALIRHKDVLKKQIIDIVEKEESEFILKQRNKDVSLYISPQLSKAQKGTIICENNAQNREKLAKEWENYVKEETTIIFLSPQTPTNWSICPYIHQKIKGKSHVLKDLESLAANA